MKIALPDLLPYFYKSKSPFSCIAASKNRAALLFYKKGYGCLPILKHHIKKKNSALPGHRSHASCRLPVR